MYDPIKPYKKQILDAIKKTWKTPFVTVKSGVYPVITKKFDFPEVDHTDGIGTKGYYHWKAGTLKNAVIDALAMNLNDLAMARAVPYKLQNHITVPVEDERVLKTVQFLAAECKKRKIAITGGENSFHENIDAIDISITVSGFVKKPTNNRFKIGDTLVGLQSSGIHSNGFTLVNKLFGDEIRPEFLEPTRIYLDQVLDLVSKHKVNGMMHITGGSFSKLKELLIDSAAKINNYHRLGPQEIFYELYRKGVTDKKMYTTFNCGIGFVLSTNKTSAEKIVSKFNRTAIIGEVVAGSGKVIIDSFFSKTKVVI